MSKEKTTTEMFGDITPDQGALWGKQTQLSLTYFNIGEQRFSLDFIYTLVQIKRICADINLQEKHMGKSSAKAIQTACDAILKGQYDDQFPLHVWQTGSGTQTNMNVNEVIASLANKTIKRQNKSIKNTDMPIHPNDHVNMSQSSNDVFPTAMHVTVAVQTRDRLFPALDTLINELKTRQKPFDRIITVGRTHMMDALPLKAGAALSAFTSQLLATQKSLTNSLNDIYALAIGGTAVGSGSNAPKGFGEKVAAGLKDTYGLPFRVRKNRYAAVSSEDALCRFHGLLKSLATVLLKMANDFRLLGSGPRCGLNEWKLPANEPGSSIMPGKVNPTQPEALSMICLQVFGNDLTVSMAASQGQLQLNTYRPVIIHNTLESLRLLSDGMTAFAAYCVKGLELNLDQIERNREHNLSTATVLAPVIGYETVARIVHEAHDKQISLKAAANNLSLYTEAEFASLLQKALAEQKLLPTSGK